jgi:hypothetical protein
LLGIESLSQGFLPAPSQARVLRVVPLDIADGKFFDEVTRCRQPARQNGGFSACRPF